MNVELARSRAVEYNHLHAFIALGTDTEGFAVAVKDVIDVAGLPTTAGTSALPATTPETDAPVVAAVRAAGGGIVGKANLHEWAIGLTSDNPSFGRVVNPRYPELMAGGSSGGSAAAVAAELCDWAIGTDTGGSIRVPAAACGVVGLKPTLGLLSNAGVVQVSESLDTVGPIAPSVAVIRSAMSILTGAESQESASAGFTLVRPRVEWLGPLEPSVAGPWASITRSVEEIALPDRQSLTDASWVVLAYEAARFHRDRLERSPEVFSADVRAVLDAGIEMSEDQYLAALDGLKVAAVAYDEAVGSDRVLMTPASAAAIPVAGSGASREPLTRYTRPFNGTGQPTLCLPVPRQPGAGPMAVQLVAARDKDLWLIDAAEAIETQWAAGPTID